METKQKKFLHPTLAAGRWFELSFLGQMANIGSEIFRALKWRDKNQEYCLLAAERGLELLDLTIADPKNQGRLRELTRTREALVDHLFFDNEYNTTSQIWQNYFSDFNWAERLKK